MEPITTALHDTRLELLQALAYLALGFGGICWIVRQWLAEYRVHRARVRLRAAIAKESASAAGPSQKEAVRDSAAAPVLALEPAPAAPPRTAPRFYAAPPIGRPTNEAPWVLRPQSCDRGGVEIKQ